MPGNDALRVFLIGRGQSYDVGTFFDEGLKILGLKYDGIDYRKYFPAGSSLQQRIYLKIVSRYLSTILLNADIRRKANRFKPNVIIVVKGSGVWSKTFSYLKDRFGSILINYATDDPISLKTIMPEICESISIFDIYACTKKAIINDVKNAGCEEVIFLPFAYQPDLHYPENPQDNLEAETFDSDVVFIGGGDHDRVPYMNEISKIPGIKLHLYGGFWNRYPELKQYHKGFAIARNYRLALSGTKIAPGLVRKKNRDGHSMRSYEVPACRAFLLAERTDEHQEMFVEVKEAEFFNTTEELIYKIIFYLKNDSERKKIARNGYHRIVCGNNTYLDRLKTILELVK